MANYTGTLGLDLTLYFIPSIQQQATVLTATFESYPQGAGTIMHAVKPAPAVHYLGSTGMSAGSTLFNNIILMPQTINTGIITQNVTYPATIWNAYHDASYTITSAPIVNGIQASNLIIPTSLGPFQSVAFSYLVTMQGNLQINDTFAITTSTYNVFTTFVGTRGVAFLYSPIDGYTESPYFANDIFTSYNGYEVITPLMWREKYKFNYQILASNQEYQGIISALKKDNSLPTLHPIWFALSQLTATATIGSTVINCSTAYMNIKANDYVAIWTTPYNFEIKIIASYTSSTITITAPLVANWGVGSNVAPCRNVTLNNGDFSYLSDDITKFDLTFEEI